MFRLETENKRLNKLNDESNRKVAEVEAILDQGQLDFKEIELQLDKCRSDITEAEIRNQVHLDK